MPTARSRSSTPDIAEYQRSAVSALMDHDGVRARRQRGRRAARPRSVRAVRPPLRHRPRRSTRSQTLVAAAQRRARRRLRPAAVPISTARSPPPSSSRVLKTQRAPRHRRARRPDARARSTPSRDAVVVVGPAASRRGSGLTVAAIRAPSVSPGSAAVGDEPSHRVRVRRRRRAHRARPARASARPTTWKGASCRCARSGTTAKERTDFLIDANKDAVFRDARVSGVLHRGARPRGAARARDRDHARAARRRAPRPCSWARSRSSGSSTPPTSPAR